MKNFTTFLFAFVFSTLSWYTYAQTFNSGSCPKSLAIPDNDPTGIKDTIAVTGVGTMLGTDVILESVTLHITHTWSSDIDVFLTSPNGVTVELVTDAGGSGRQYGDDCNNMTVISMSASTIITSGTGNFVGSFLPEGNMDDFNDGSDANGNWVLSVADDAGGDIGNLEFVELLFGTPPTCPAPDSLYVMNVTTTSADLGWMEMGTASQWQVEYGVSGFSQGSGTFLNASTTPSIGTGGVLSPNTMYEYYVRAICGPGDTSTWVGPYSFYTGYCLPSSSSASSYIDNFTTSNGNTNISNLASGFTTGGYYDGTSMAVESYAGGSFDFNAEIVGGTVGFSIWVDWNNDMVFDNATEKVFNTTAYGNGPFTGTINIPGGASMGDYRMRITTDWNQSNPSLPCGNQSRAEFEDYTITVGNPPSCVAPSGITPLVVNGTDALIDWTENGTATTWQVQWGPAGFMLGSGTTDTTSIKPYFMAPLVPNTAWDFYVRSVCGAGDTSSWVGPLTFMTPCVAPVISAFPWTENFDGETTPDMPCGWVVDNANTDAYTWETNSTNSVSPSNSMAIRWNSAAAMDDWAFTPQLDLTGGQAYQLSFEFAVQGATFPEKLMVMYGNGQNSGAMTTMLFDSTFNNTAFETATAIFTPATTGSYFIGFHGYSDADMFRMFVDDVTVDMATGINTNNKDVFAIYPNPTTGILTIKGNTTNSNVNVTNIHGQSVYRNTVIGNQLTIDLSKEAKGLYLVSISNENGTQIHKVIVQ
ncbi:MAG: T9SS type A sorting domain-containing protein [Flavobacteriales bacterium]|nr:T9SS type A sorting domain-containing protein [Flavobacteriales bacterium]